MTGADIDDLQDISSFFTELAVCDYFFVTMRPSAVALACILNALEGMFGHDNSFGIHVLAAARKLSLYTDQDLSAACHRLWELYERSEECAVHNSFEPMEEEKVGGSGHVIFNKVESVSTSPVTVTSKTCKSMPSDELMCAMRSKHLRNGSW
jgi:hypothetical protein